MKRHWGDVTASPATVSTAEHGSTGGSVAAVLVAPFRVGASVGLDLPAGIVAANVARLIHGQDLIVLHGGVAATSGGHLKVFGTLALHNGGADGHDGRLAADIVVRVPVHLARVLAPQAGLVQVAGLLASHLATVIVLAADKVRHVAVVAVLVAPKNFA